MSILPERDNLIGVIGGRHLSDYARRIAGMLGSEIIRASYKLATGGRRGAGQCASEGAAQFCERNDLVLSDHVFSLVPFGRSPDFDFCQVVHAGKNKFERRMILMNCTKAVFVIGGGRGTEEEIMHVAVEHYMAWGTAWILPVSGTRGVADWILKEIHSYGDSVLDDPIGGMEKAARLVESIDEFSHSFDVSSLWGVDIHDGWLSGSKHPVVRKTYKIRHYSKLLGF